MEQIKNTVVLKSASSPSVFDSGTIVDSSGTVYEVNDRRLITTYPVANMVMQNDNVSKNVSIRIDRYYDGIDLSTKEINVAYSNAYKEEGLNYIRSEYIDVFEDYIIVNWWVSGGITSAAGKVEFQLRFHSTGDQTYIWQTVISTFEVGRSITTNTPAAINYYSQERSFELSNRVAETWSSIVDYDLPVDIENRTIKNVPGDLVLTGDTNSQVLSFTMARFIDGVDISKKVISIKYVNANNQSDRSAAINIIINESTVQFSWLINSRFTYYTGTGMFAIEILGYNFPNKTDNPTSINPGDLEFFYVWQTKPVKITIGPSLYIDGSIAYPGPEWEAKWQLDSTKNLEDTRALKDEAEGYASDAFDSALFAQGKASDAWGFANQAWTSAGQALSSAQNAASSALSVRGLEEAAAESAEEAREYRDQAENYKNLATGTAGGDLEGMFPEPSVKDDSHNHTVATIEGVLPLTGGVVSGDLEVSGTLKLGGANTLYIEDIVEGNAVDVVTSGEYYAQNDSKVYHENNKPTSIDSRGELPCQEGTNTDSILGLSVSSYNGTGGPESLEYGNVLSIANEDKTGSQFFCGIADNSSSVTNPSKGRLFYRGKCKTDGSAENTEWNEWSEVALQGESVVFNSVMTHGENNSIVFIKEFSGTNSIDVSRSIKIYTDESNEQLNREMLKITSVVNGAVDLKVLGDIYSLEGKLAPDSKLATFYFEVPTTGWSTEAPYTNIITTSGAEDYTADDVPTIDVYYPDGYTSEEEIAADENYAMVTRVDTIDGGIKLTCREDLPTANFWIMAKGR